jgi:hypothetical protein
VEHAIPPDLEALYDDLVAAGFEPSQRRPASKEWWPRRTRLLRGDLVVRLWHQGDAWGIDLASTAWGGGWAAADDVLAAVVGTTHGDMLAEFSNSEVQDFVRRAAWRGLPLMLGDTAAAQTMVGNAVRLRLAHRSGIRPG